MVEKTLLDLSKNGVKNDILNLLHETSKTANIKIKTPVAITRSKEMEKLIMQGENVSSILCTSSMDTMSKECDKEPYKYRDEVDIPSLGFVDDLVDVQRCGNETKELNDYTNGGIIKIKLQCNTNKCHRKHVGKDRKCKSLFIESWKKEKENVDGKSVLKDKHEGQSVIDTVKEQIYLGKDLSSDASNENNVEMKRGC